MRYLPAFCLLFMLQSLSAQSVKPRAVINHTAIYVVNLQASVAFYGHVIGLDTVPEPFHDGKHAWFRTGEHSMLHIIEGAPQKKDYYKNSHTCFSVTNLTDFTGLLQQRKIAYEDVNGKPNAITTRTDGVHQIWLRDPDGYWVEVNDDRF